LVKHRQSGTRTIDGVLKNWGKWLDGGGKDGDTEVSQAYSDASHFFLRTGLRACVSGRFHKDLLFIFLLR
jgi:hypothetical protein